MRTKEAYSIIQKLGKQVNMLSKPEKKDFTVTGLAFVTKFKKESPPTVIQAAKIVKEDIVNFMLSTK